jgi:hypothetical protein
MKLLSCLILGLEKDLTLKLPKQMALDKVNEKEAFKATDLMNNRPRKCLGLFFIKFIRF